MYVQLNGEDPGCILSKKDMDEISELFTKIGEEMLKDNRPDYASKFFKIADAYDIELQKELAQL